MSKPYASSLAIKSPWDSKVQNFKFIKVIWSSNRKLAWVGFEPTTTEFYSDARTDWVRRPWVQLALRANFLQLIHFVVCSVSDFILVIAFVSCHVYFNGNFLEKITSEWSNMNDPTCDIDHWRFIWSSYRLLAWVGFESTTTQYRNTQISPPFVAISDPWHTECSNLTKARSKIGVIHMQSWKQCGFQFNTTMPLTQSPQPAKSNEYNTYIV